MRAVNRALPHFQTICHLVHIFCKVPLLYRRLRSLSLPCTTVPQLDFTYTVSSHYYYGHHKGRRAGGQKGDQFWEPSIQAGGDYTTVKTLFTSWNNDLCELAEQTTKVLIPLKSACLPHHQYISPARMLLHRSLSFYLAASPSLLLLLPLYLFNRPV